MSQQKTLGQIAFEKIEEKFAERHPGTIRHTWETVKSGDDSPWEPSAWEAAAKAVEDAVLADVEVLIRRELAEHPENTVLGRTRQRLLAEIAARREARSMVAILDTARN